MFFDSTNKVLFICKKRNNSYGISFGLVNSAMFVANALRTRGVQAKVVTVVDNNSIDKEVTKISPTHVMIEALWVVSEKFHVLIKKHPNIKWVIRIHSQLPFIANEGIAIEWLFKYKKLCEQYPKQFFISANHMKFVNDVKGLGFNCLYLPNIYAPDYPVQHKSCKPSDTSIDIGCFGAIRPMKNHLSQAVAACKFADRIGKKLNFHINGSRTEQNGDQVLKNLRALFENNRHSLVEHDWLNHQDFLKLIQKIEIGMQVSFSETFNIVTGDFVASNIPVVVSSSIDWLPFWTKADPSDSEKIANKLYFVWWWKTFNLQGLNEITLRIHNKKSVRVWLEYLDEI